MNGDGKMRLAALVHATGSHPASWLHPDTKPSASTDIDSYAAMAQAAERGKFRSVLHRRIRPRPRTDNLLPGAASDVHERVRAGDAVVDAGKPDAFDRLGGRLDQLTEPLHVPAVRFARSSEPWARRVERRPSATTYRPATSVSTSMPQARQPARRAVRGQFVEVVKALLGYLEGRRPSSTIAPPGVYFDPNQAACRRHQGKFFTLHGRLEHSRARRRATGDHSGRRVHTGKDFAALNRRGGVSLGCDAGRRARDFIRDLKGRIVEIRPQPDQLKILAASLVIVGGRAGGEGQVATLARR